MLSISLQIYINSPKQPSISTILTKKTIPAQRFHRISEPRTSTRPPMVISITGKNDSPPSLGIGAWCTFLSSGMSNSQYHELGGELEKSALIWEHLIIIWLFTKKIWEKVWWIQFLWLSSRTILPRIYILRIKTDKKITLPEVTEVLNARLLSRRY